MKRLLIIVLIITTFLTPTIAFAANTVVVAATEIRNTGTKYLTFTCVGNTTGEIPSTSTNATTDSDGNTVDLDSFIAGWYAEEIQVEPGSTAPDAAGITFKDDMGADFLDGMGTVLIHATDTKSSTFYCDGMPMCRRVVGTMTLEDDGNQTTNAATYTVRIKFTQVP